MVNKEGLISEIMNHKMNIFLNALFLMQLF